MCEKERFRKADKSAGSPKSLYPNCVEMVKIIANNAVSGIVERNLYRMFSNVFDFKIWILSTCPYHFHSLRVSDQTLIKAVGSVFNAKKFIKECVE